VLLVNPSLILAILPPSIYPRSQLLSTAMSLQIPSSPSDGSSTSCSTHPPSPLTPPQITESFHDPNADPNSATILPAPAGKRKPSRRANTAERRATHNAVERQRRETLNSRFLVSICSNTLEYTGVLIASPQDLAGLLPNLSQIRRPSKSAIVNSSIAHIHASRRHRLIAARELRMVKTETDALRRELNEWRDRSGLPRMEEPPRSESFNLVLSGEVEVIVPSTQNDDEDNMEDDGDDDLHSGSSEDVEEVARTAAVNLIKPSRSPTSAPSPTSHQFAHNTPSLPVHQNGVAHPHSQQVPGGPQPHPAVTQLLHGRQHPHAIPSHHTSTGGPIIANHYSPASYENPALIYDNYHPSQFGYNLPQSYTSGQLPPHILAQLTTEMDQKASPGWYNNSTGQFTPPSSSGGPSPVGSPFSGIGGGFSSGYPANRYVGEGVVGRERSTSIGSRRSPVGSYELVTGAHMENIPRWRNDGIAGAPGPNPVSYSLLM
jgi:hypothetical protein